MRRSIYALTWALGTTLAVVFAWWGVSIVGDQVITARDTPVHEAGDELTVTTAPLPDRPRDDTLSDTERGALYDGLTANLDAVTTTTTLPPDIVTAPPSAPGSTALPRSPVPATTPTPPAAVDTPSTLPPDTTPTTGAPPPVTPSVTTPPTSAPPPVATTTTTAPAHTTGTFPPGWDDSAGFEPLAEGTSTYSFDCGEITIHWRDYHVARVTGRLADGNQQCVEQYQGASIDVGTDHEANEIVFTVTYPDGHEDEYRMPIQVAPPG